MTTDHVPEEWLDQYSKGELRGESRNDLLDHVLICAECRQRLTERLTRSSDTDKGNHRDAS